jgi:fibronectin type III domain protein
VSPPRTFPPALPDRRRRAPLVALVLVATLALVGGVISAVVAFQAVRTRPGSTAAPPGGGQPSSAGPTFPPPADLRLRDDGTSITLTWTDPSHGTAPFIVAGGRADRAPSPLHTVGSGETTYTVNGLSGTTEYCFLVAAVYSPEHTAPSTLVCTHRSTSPTPTPSR